MVIGLSPKLLHGDTFHFPSPGKENIALAKDVFQAGK